ncbi:MAG: phosphotransferase [Gammaproteobacteria bacterium]
MEGIEQILRNIPGLENLTSYELLHSGAVNQTWKIEAGGNLYVLRSGNSIAKDIGQDVVGELEVMQVASQANLGPQPVWCDESSRLLLSRYLPGKSLTKDVLHETAYSEVLELLSRLHASRPAVRVVDYAGYIRRYAAAVNSPDGEAMEAEALDLARSWCGDISRYVLCHTDPTASNFIAGPDTCLRLIDWEYGGLGEPCLDLAVLIVEYGFTQDQVIKGSCVVDTIERLAGCVRLYRLMNALWSMMCCNRSRHAGQ